MATTRASNKFKKGRHINHVRLYKRKERMNTVVNAIKMAKTVEGKTGKVTIPLALRQQVWLTYIGRSFETKCLVRWCTNRISAFEFDVGHNIPESKGGTLDMSNLRPICHKCNISMSNTYTIDEWNQLSKPVACCGWWCC